MTGSTRARVVESLLGDLHRVLSGVQLGITLTGLALGALGEVTIAKELRVLWPGKPGAFGRGRPRPSAIAARS